MRLTRDEILLITSITVALLAGSLIKHYRDRARILAHPKTPAVEESQAQE